MDNNEFVTNPESKAFPELKKIVMDAINEEKLITQKILQNKEKKALKLGERVADQVAAFGGSWTFIISFFIILVIWIGTNSLIWLNKGFDPYPYILLNLILSCIAALQAPVIMMSQNRKEQKDRERAESDYLINLKAEIEIRNLHQKIDLLILKEISQILDNQEIQMKILKNLDKK
jgi:uncharacterized membrane protein